MKEESHDYGMDNGHSPMASDTVCLDFDGTLYPWGPLSSRAAPNPGAVAAVTRLKEAGFRIVIFTSRLSPTWCFSEYESPTAQHNYIEDILNRDGIPYDVITCEKVPAVAYVDDKAVVYSGNDDEEWGDIADYIISRYGEGVKK